MNIFQVNGIARDYTFLDLDLHDGVSYYVTLISCNGAELCSHIESDPILVDSSPPTRGVFMSLHVEFQPTIGVYM